MSGIQVKILADSISAAGKRITSYQLRFPRFILAEVNTHAALSKSASSSRAIPVKKVLSQVWNDPAMPIHWGANQPGMQADEELKGWRLKAAKAVWKVAGKVACGFAWLEMKIGLHKQVANRLLETWQWTNQVITGTEWENFFSLRCHKDAQPEFRHLAVMMRGHRDVNVPTPIPTYDWHGPRGTTRESRTAEPRFHAPYIFTWEWETYNDDEIGMMSSARCARSSYNNHNGRATNYSQDRKLFEKLAVSRPVHASPLAHQGFAYEDPEKPSRNFRGWHQFRERFENHGILTYEAPGVVNG